MSIWNPCFILGLCRLGIRMALGVLFNLAGIPGLIKNCDYHANVADAQITVRVRSLFTVVTVNSVEIYFHRLTGVIDGIGFSPASCCTVNPIAGSVDLDAQRADRHLQSQTQIL